MSDRPAGRAALATIFAEGLLGRLTFGMVSFAMPLYATALGVPLSQVGILIAIRTAVVLPFKPIAGWLVDRVGLRAVYLAAVLARTLSAVALFFAGDFVGLLSVRVLQGVSSAGRDVGSLGVIAKGSPKKVGSHYGLYASSKHLGNIGGAAAAGVLIAAGGGHADIAAYQTLFAIVLGMSVLPLVVSWFGLRGLGRGTVVQHERAAPAHSGDERARPRGTRARRPLAGRLDGLLGVASVGMLVSTTAYMVHGLYPVLATEYAGLSEAQAGIIYSASGLVFVIAAPTFGWIIDRRGRTLGIALRSLCNIGSSVLYVVLPSLGGIAAARVVDDSGKAAFQPAWASVVAEVASTDPASSGRRLGALDTAGTVGEALGPIVATVLWQTGGVLLLFGVRIAISAVAEITALRVFGELRGSRLASVLRRSPPRAPTEPSREAA